MMLEVLRTTISRRLSKLEYFVTERLGVITEVSTLSTSNTMSSVSNREDPLLGVQQIFIFVYFA